MKKLIYIKLTERLNILYDILEAEENNNWGNLTDEDKVQLRDLQNALGKVLDYFWGKSLTAKERKEVGLDQAPEVFICG